MDQMEPLILGLPKSRTVRTNKSFIMAGTNSMDLAGDLVQSLGSYLGLEDLTSTAHFPTELTRLETLLAK